MNISQLLEALKDTTVTLTVSEKLLAGVSVALLSMSVVIVVLVLISILISFLQREKKNTLASASISIEEKVDVVANINKDMELVSVITAAISSATGISSDNLVVRKITRNNNSQSSWQTMPKYRTK